jgi:hypothetical protein
MAALAVLVVLALPIAALIALLRLASVLEARRAEVVARQIALTDAIHAVLGAVVAPVVRRGRAGRWVATLALAPEQRDIERLVEIARETLGASAHVVLTTSPAAPGRPAQSRLRTAAAMSA